MATGSSILAWEKKTMDRGAWKATVDEVAKSRTQLNSNIYMCVYIYIYTHTHTYIYILGTERIIMRMISVLESILFVGKMSVDMV